MQAHGVRVMTGCEVLAWAAATCSAVADAPARSIELARRRRADLDRAQGRRGHLRVWTAAGIAYVAQGHSVDEYLRTTAPGIWAIGDATGKSILAHVGIQQGIVAAENRSMAWRADGSLRPWITA